MKYAVQVNIYGKPWTLSERRTILVPCSENDVHNFYNGWWGK